jgi:hypothetical protein
MPRTLNPLISLVAITALAGAACDKVHYRTHEFAPATLHTADGAEISVSVFGSWSTKTAGDSSFQTRASPYIVELRIRGAQRDRLAVGLDLVDATSGSVTRISDWDVSTIDRADSSVVLVYRRGVAIPPRDQSVRVEVTSGVGPDSRVYSRDLALRYSYHESSKLRLFERAKGL